MATGNRQQGDFSCNNRDTSVAIMWLPVYFCDTKFYTESEVISSDSQLWIQPIKLVSELSSVTNRVAYSIGDLFVARDWRNNV